MTTNTNEEILKELKALREQVAELSDPEPRDPGAYGGSHGVLYYLLDHAAWCRRRNKRRGL